MNRVTMKSNEKICSVCGKKFIVTHLGTYLYKIKHPTVKYQCSEKCWRKAKEVK